MHQIVVTTLLNAALVTGASPAVATGNTNQSNEGYTYQATVVGTGAVTATVLIQGSLDNVNWVTIGTITLSGTTSATDGFASLAPWAYQRANCTAVTGTGAAVTALMGV